MIDKLLDLVIWIYRKLGPWGRARDLKESLRELLSGKWKWRRLKTLMLRTGATEKECRKALLEIGARGSKGRKDEEIWGLKERVGPG